MHGKDNNGSIIHIRSKKRGLIIGVSIIIKGDYPLRFIERARISQADIDAMAFASEYYGPEASEGFVYFMKCDQGVWRIVKRMTVYVS
jgi:hypothetical protein